MILTLEQQVATAKAYRHILTAMNLLEKAFKHSDPKLNSIHESLLGALNKLGYMCPTPDITSQKEIKRALYWKIHYDSLASNNDVKRSSNIWEMLKSGIGISDSNWDFVMEVVGQYTIAKLAKSSVNNRTGGK